MHALAAEHSFVRIMTTMERPLSGDESRRFSIYKGQVSFDRDRISANCIAACERVF